MLRNDDRKLEAAALIGLAVAGLAGFALVLVAVLFDPQAALADAAIGQFLQGLRTDWATSAMVGITMTGDMAVLPVVVLLIAGLVASRQWVMAGTVTAASLAGAIFVPVFKGWQALI